MYRNPAFALRQNDYFLAPFLPQDYRSVPEFSLVAWRQGNEIWTAPILPNGSIEEEGIALLDEDFADEDLILAVHRELH